MAAIGLMVSVLGLFYLLKKTLQSKLHIRKSKSYPFVIEMFLKTKLFFLAALSLYLCIPLLPKELTPFISTLTFIATTIQAGVWANYLLLYFIERIQFKDESGQGISVA